MEFGERKNDWCEGEKARDGESGTGSELESEVQLVTKSNIYQNCNVGVSLVLVGLISSELGLFYQRRRQKQTGGRRRE